MGYEPGTEHPAPWEEVAISFWEGFSDGFYDYVGKFCVMCLKENSGGLVKIFKQDGPCLTSRIYYIYNSCLCSEQGHMLAGVKLWPKSLL